MDVTRAQEILRTEQTVDVSHEGLQVWIDSVNQSDRTATVHAKNNPDKQITVPLDQLQEG